MPRLLSIINKAISSVLGLIRSVILGHLKSVLDAIAHDVCFEWKTSLFVYYLGKHFYYWYLFCLIKRNKNIKWHYLKNNFFGYLRYHTTIFNVFRVVLWYPKGVSSYLILARVEGCGQMQRHQAQFGAIRARQHPHIQSQDTNWYQTQHLWPVYLIPPLHPLIVYQIPAVRMIL